MVAITVAEDGYHEILGAAEGMKEVKDASFSGCKAVAWMGSSWSSGVGDKCTGTLEAVGKVFQEANYQGYAVHFYRNAFSIMPRSKMKLIAKK